MHKKAIAVNTLSQLAGKIISILLNLVIVYFLTHHYSLTQFGEYTAVFSYLLLFNILADLGLSTILVRDIHEYPEEKHPQFVGNLIIIRSISLVVSLGIGVLIAQFIPQYDTVIKIGILIGSASTFALLLATLLFSVFQLRLQLQRSVYANIVGIALNLVLVYIFVKLDLPITFGIVALTLGYIAMMGIALIQIIHIQNLDFHIDMVMWKKILRESITLGGAIIFSTIYFKSDSVLLSLMKPYADVSLYGVPYKILEVLIALPQMFMAPIFTIMAGQIKQNDLDGFKRIFQKAFDYLVLGGLPIVPGAIFLSHTIIPLYAGAKYDGSIDILKILSLAVTLSFIGSSFIFVLLLFKKQSYLLWWNIFLSLFNITLNLIFIPKYTYFASAWITVATELLVLGGAIYFVHKTIHLTPTFYVFAKGFAATVVFSAIMYLLSHTNFILETLAALTGYVFILFLVRAIKLSDIQEVLQKN